VEAWRECEQQLRGRTIAVIDQVVRHSPQCGGTQGEVDEFLNAVAEVFGPIQHTASRLIVFQFLAKEFIFPRIETGFIDRKSLSRCTCREFVSSNV